MENRTVTFHVHLPANIEKLGNPIVIGDIGDGKQLGGWKNSIVKLLQPYPDHPTYWKSKPIVISNAIKYAYAIQVPSSFLSDEKIICEGNSRSFLCNGKHQYDIWINGNVSELKKYQIDSNDIPDYAFVNCIYNNISIHNLRENILEYQKLLSIPIHKELTIKFSNYDYVFKSIDENSLSEQRLFLCFLLGYHMPRDSHPYRLPAKFTSEHVLIKSFLDYQKGLLPPDANDFLIKAFLCLIQHNASQSKLDWLIIFKIIKEIDPEYSFLKNLQNIKYNKKYLEKIKYHINEVEFEDKKKITQWLVLLCQNLESLFEVWNIFLIRNKQISQYFIYRIHDIISNNNSITLMNNFSKIPKDFRERVSYTFRKRVILLLKNPDKSWPYLNTVALREFFKNDDLNWNNDDIISSLELISQSHSLELLKVFPVISHDLFHKDFYDTRIPIICKTWFNQYLFKLGIRNTPTTTYVIAIFQQLDYFYPLLSLRVNIWRDLSDIAICKVKGYSDSCILGATKSMMEIKEQEVKRLFFEIAKEILNKIVQQANDQLINEIFLICGHRCKMEMEMDETFDTLDVPNTMCEDILCYIMFILQSQFPTYNHPSEQYLFILKSSNFWKIILNATGNVEKLKADSYVQRIQMFIAELHRLLFERTIDIRLLRQILEYSNEDLLQPFTTLKTKNLSDKIITQDDIAILRILHDDYANRLDQLLKFYEEFCSASKVTDANYYIDDIQRRMQNSDKVMLKQVLVSDHWEFHEKALNSSDRCHKFIQSQTFRNVFEVCIREDVAATNVEYIVKKLIPTVFKKYNATCKIFKTWEKVKCSEALLFWKNVKDVNAEFDLIEELGPYRNEKLIQTLERLLKLTLWTEKLEQLEKIERIFQIQHNKNLWISKSINILKDSFLELGKVNQFFEYLERNFNTIDQNCWDWIKELSIAEEFLDFIKMISEKDIKNLMNNIDDYSDELLIKEDTILSLIQIKQFLFLFMNKKNRIQTVADFLDELPIINNDPTLVSKFALCNGNKALRNIYYSISNHELITIEKFKNAVLDGTFIFVCAEKKEECSVTLKCQISLAKNMYDLNEILNLREKALLMAGSKITNDFIDLVDIIQKIINVATMLMQRGHFDYRKFEKKIKGTENMKVFLEYLIDELETWENIMNQVHKLCYYLTFFTSRHILAFHDYFTSEKLDKENEEMCKTLIRFVNRNAQLPSRKGGKGLSRESHDHFGSLRGIGNKLENIFLNIPKQRRKFEIIQQGIIPDDVTKNKLFVAAYNDKLLVPNIIMSLYANNRYYPEPWQLLMCTSSTTMEELTIFIKRCFFAAENEYEDHLFCIVNLESLDFELQCTLVDYIKEMQFENRNENYLLALLCHRELGISQYILDQHSLEVLEINGLDTESMQEIYQDLCSNMLCVSSDLSGQGKTEWIKEVSFSKHKIPRSFLISDGISLEYLVNKFKEFKLKDIESLHINILSADYPEDVNLFLFELLVSIPETLIFIEIATSELCDFIPMTGFLPRNHLSWDIKNYRVSQEITSPVQIACHYLNLYDHGEIDTKEIFFNTSKAIKDPLSAEFCQNLIMKYSNDKNILSFRYMEIFVNVLADQLIRLSSSQYFTINNLKLRSKENDIRSTIIKSLIEVSKDFATRSIKNKEVRDNQWDHSNHIIIFSNSQTPDSCSVLYHNKNKVPDNVKLLVKNQTTGDQKVDHDCDTMPANNLLTILEGMARGSMQKLDLPEYVLFNDNMMKMALILLRVRANIPVVICGEAGCGKTSLITYLALVAEVQFQVLNIHAGIDEKFIITFMSDATKKADKGEIWVLFDEINTCNNLGLLAELISNRIFRGEPIHPNIRLFSTCNPYRLRTQDEVGRTTNIKKYKERSDLIYQVKPLPDQILDYVWNYGVLNKQDEYRYIQIMIKNELKELALPVLSDLLSVSQQFIRKFEEPYSVSLRDVRRAITLVKFFYNTLNNRPAYKKAQPENITTLTRSYVLALSLCYHFRLHEQDLRKQYRYEIGQVFQNYKTYVGEKIFVGIIREEQEDYISRMQVPSNVAKNEALLENVLVMTVCILTKIPIFVIGEAGSSKSLAIRLIRSNLRGSESNDDYFKTLPKVYIVSYLCSSSSTSDGINKVFEKANRYQETDSDVINVVLLNNVGFAESSPSNPLKALHYSLEPNYPATESTVSFVGISNWRLDISKSSRVLLVQRPRFDLDDLVDTAECLLDTKVIEPGQISVIESLAKAYSDYEKHGQALPNFHGLRDYYSLIKRISLFKLAPDNIQMALARNFGGIEDNSKLWEKYFRNIIKSPWSYKPVQLIKSNLDDPDARHLMVIGKSETTVSLLTDQLKRKKMNPVVIMGSQFPDDRDDYYNSVLSRIMTCVETGRTLILTDLEIIYASLYDLWDQNYIVVGSKENAKYLSRVALGACADSMFYVSPSFKCIIVIDEKSIRSADPSLFNRFEKQRLSINDILNERQQSLVQQLKDWTGQMYTFGNDPMVQLHDKSTLFVGFDKDESLQNLVIDITKNYPYAEDDELLKRCKESLIAVATSDGIVRAEKSSLNRDEIIMLKNFYFHQHHDNLYDYLESLFNQKNSGGNLVIANTFSGINTNVKSCLDDLVKCQVYKLSIFKTEAQISNLVKDFFLKSADQILILQCEDTAVNERYIKLTKYIIEQYQNEYLAKKGQLKINMPTKFVCIIHHIRRDCENLILSSFIPGWKLITIESLEQQNIPLRYLLDKSLYDVINSEIFGKIVNSKMPFEIILKEELSWCLSCIEYQIPKESYKHYISTLSKEILHSEKFIPYIKTKTFEWIIENCKDWQFEVAGNQEYLNQFASFSLALQNYVKIIIKQTIAKILYSLEKLSATRTFFTIENDENEINAELSDLWKQCFINNAIININNLPEPRPSGYEISCSMINELGFPFSFYFMNQIDFYKIYYDEELDILRQDLDNINSKTKELHEELIEEQIESFTNNLLTIKPNFRKLQKYSELYYNDFIKILSSSYAAKRLNSKKELDFIFRHLIGDQIVNNPFLLHIYWWKYADNILIQLQLIEAFPTIFVKAQEEFIVYGKFDLYLFEEAIDFVLQNIWNNEEWEQKMDDILSLVDKMNNTKDLTNLPLLLICNDLLKIKMIPLEKIKEMIYLGKSPKKQEFITVRMIELIFDQLDYNDDLTPIRSFIMKSLDIIPLKSEVRLVLYQNLFSRKPFKLTSEIIEKIFITENQEKDGIFFTLIKNPDQALQHSIRLDVINDCLSIDTNMAEFCCEIIQTIFNEYELKELIPYFKHSVENFTGHLVLQHISATAFLKEFIFKFFENYTREDSLPKSLIKEINDCLNIKHPFIRSIKSYFSLQQKNFSIEFKTLKNVFPWIKNDIEVEITYLLKLWRPIRKVNFEDFRAFYNSVFIRDLNNYPFLSVYFNHYERLKLIKYLRPIVKFVKILNSKLEYNLTRKSAQTMTFHEFIEKESRDDSKNGKYLKSLFEEFAIGWNSVINYIVQYQSKELPLSKPSMSLELPVIFGLIEQKDTGTYLCAILEFLIKLHNEFLDNVLTIPVGKCKFLKDSSWKNATSKDYFIKSVKVSQAQDNNFINYELDEKIILKHSQRNLEREETRFIFDLQRIETLLVKEFVFNKVYFKKEDNQFYLKDFSFKHELFHNSMRILFDIKKVLPQKPIPIDKIAIVLKMFQPTNSSLNLDISVNLSELLFLFEIILGFIKELSINNGDILIIDFVNQWLKLERLVVDDTAKYKIFKKFSLKHIVELYELIEEQVASTVIHEIDNKFKVPLLTQMKESINNCLDYYGQNENLIPAKAFVLALKKFIYRFLTIDTDIKNLNLSTYFLDFAIDLWPGYIEEELIVKLFPTCLLVSHAYSCYTFIVNEIEEAKNTAKKINVKRIRN